MIFRMIGAGSLINQSTKAGEFVVSQGAFFKHVRNDKPGGAFQHIIQEVVGGRQQGLQGRTCWFIKVAVAHGSGCQVAFIDKPAQHRLGCCWGPAFGFGGLGINIASRTAAVSVPPNHFHDLPFSRRQAALIRLGSSRRHDVYPSFHPSGDNRESILYIDRLKVQSIDF